jgi:hypothetical protein
MILAATIDFIDVGTSDQACAVVRYDDSFVALGLSLKRNGDVQVVLSKEDAKAIIRALQQAVS